VLLVGLEMVEHGVDVQRQRRSAEIQMVEEALDPVGALRRRDAASDADTGGGPQPIRDGLTVEEVAEARGGLDRVPQGVPEVEREARSGLPLVRQDDLDLRPRCPLDDLGEGAGFRRGCVARRDRGTVRLQRLEQSVVSERRHLHGLGESRAPLADVEGREDGHVGHDGRGLVERADEVLALRQVNAGLAADRRIKVCDERRRDLDERHPTEVGRGKEPGRVAERSAADRDERLAAFHAQSRKLTRSGFDDRKPLRVLALRKQHPLDGPAVAREVAGEPRSDGGPGARLGHDDRATGTGLM
jgi:hypothetical protein